MDKYQIVCQHKQKQTKWKHFLLKVKVLGSVLMRRRLLF